MLELCSTASQRNKQEKGIAYLLQEMWCIMEACLNESHDWKIKVPEGTNLEEIVFGKWNARHGMDPTLDKDDTIVKTVKRKWHSTNNFVLYLKKEDDAIIS